MTDESVFCSLQVDNISIFVSGAGMEQSALLLRPLVGLLYQPLEIDVDNCGGLGG
jgi:hypothetical protein